MGDENGQEGEDEIDMEMHWVFFFLEEWGVQRNKIDQEGDDSPYLFQVPRPISAQDMFAHTAPMMPIANNATAA